MAQVTLEGNARKISVAMIEAPALGDYVTVHAGMAWDKLEPEEAQEILAAIELACLPPGAIV
ncbi:hydrogenase expression/formation protein HypC [Rhodobacter sp. JA431]|nr:hydrogenase expression/formation protein HypC [Rhodobacter sp. JA431]